MSKIEQFVYTSSPWGKGSAGWMVFQQSPDVQPEDVKGLHSYFDYKVPDGFAAAPGGGGSLDMYPLQYVCAQMGDGRRVVVKTRYAGNRWWDGRSGDYWAHVLLMPEDSWAAMTRAKGPMGYLGSSVFGECRYTEELQAQARSIVHREESYREPPELKQLEPESVDASDEWGWERLKWRPDADAWRKVGGLLGQVVERWKNGGGAALVFDARKAESIATMALLLELMPAKWRKKAQFATYLHPDNARDVKADEEFAFYGTVREREEGDGDTGLYGEVEVGGLAFEGREDAEVLKRMVDACGEGLGAGDWDGLVACWEVVTGKRRGAEAVREAMGFAKGREGVASELVAEVKRGLEEAYEEVMRGGVQNATLEDREACWVAWFEFGLPGFKSFAEASAEAAVRDANMLGEGWDVLPGARKAWLEALLSVARSRGDEGMAELTNTWLRWREESKKSLEGVKLPQEFVTMEGYREAAEAVRAGRKGDGVRWKQQVEVLKELCGAFASNVEGFATVYGELRYRSQVKTLETRKSKGLAEFFENVGGLWNELRFEVDPSRLEGDAAACLDAGRMGADEVVTAVRLFQKHGVSPSKLLGAMEANPEKFLNMKPEEMLEGLVAFRNAELPWEGLFRQMSGQGKRFAELGGAELLKTLEAYEGKGFDAGRLLDAALAAKREEGKAEGRREAEQKAQQKFWAAQQESEEALDKLGGQLADARRTLRKSVAKWVAVLCLVLGVVVGAGGFWTGECIGHWLDGTKTERKSPAPSPKEQNKNGENNAETNQNRLNTHPDALAEARKVLNNVSNALTQAHGLGLDSMDALHDELVDLDSKVSELKKKEPPWDDEWRQEAETVLRNAKQLNAKVKESIHAAKSKGTGGHDKPSSGETSKQADTAPAQTSAPSSSDKAPAGENGNAVKPVAEGQKDSRRSQARWTPGARHPDHPHVIAGQPEETWTPAPGYKARWEGDLDPVWAPGMSYPGKPHVHAADTENEWSKDAGWDWVHPGTDDLSVRWIPGARDPAHPHIHASATEGEGAPDVGWTWKNPGNKGDRSVIRKEQ